MSYDSSKQDMKQETCRKRFQDKRELIEKHILELFRRKQWRLHVRRERYEEAIQWFLNARRERYKDARRTAEEAPYKV